MWSDLNSKSFFLTCQRFLFSTNFDPRILILTNNLRSGMVLHLDAKLVPHFDIETERHVSLPEIQFLKRKKVLESSGKSGRVFQQ